jgi:YgiT-type zinc finger domain-containing protein
VDGGFSEAGEAMTDAPSKCPRCGGALENDREVEKPVRHGDDVALVRVRADVCTQCGERLYRPEVVEWMQRVRQALKDASSKAPVVGRVYDYRAVDSR